MAFGNGYNSVLLQAQPSTGMTMERILSVENDDGRYDIGLGSEGHGGYHVRVNKKIGAACKPGEYLIVLHENSSVKGVVGPIPLDRVQIYDDDVMSRLEQLAKSERAVTFDVRIQGVHRK